MKRYLRNKLINLINRGPYRSRYYSVRKNMFKLIVKLSDVDLYLVETDHSFLAFGKGVVMSCTMEGVSTRFLSEAETDAARANYISDKFMMIANGVNARNNLKYGVTGMSHTEIIEAHTSGEFTEIFSTILTYIYGEVTLEHIRNILENLIPSWNYNGDITEVKEAIVNCLDPKDRKVLNMELQLLKAA